jgi:hypothetical protein
MARLTAIPPGEERLIAATGRYPTARSGPLRYSHPPHSKLKIKKSIIYRH